MTDSGGHRLASGGGFRKLRSLTGVSLLTEDITLSIDIDRNRHPVSALAEAHRRHRWLQHVLPPHCLHCQAPGLPGLDLCATCWDELPWNDTACPRCGLPLPHPAPACGACLKRAPKITRTLAPLRYADSVTQLLPRFKFHQQLAIGRMLAKLVEHVVLADGIADGMDALIPMPLHRKRLAQRGYNQALELARPLGKSLQLPVRLDLLHRARDTAPQTGLDARARRRNLRGAFVASPSVKGMHVVLLDDVITTGASLREASQALLRSGAAEVRALAIARADTPKHR
jgi:ComF family protein